MNDPARLAGHMHAVPDMAAGIVPADRLGAKRSARRLTHPSSSWIRRTSC
jgi:hypothetical protein